MLYVLALETCSKKQRIPAGGNGQGCVAGAFSGSSLQEIPLGVVTQVRSHCRGLTKRPAEQLDRSRGGHIRTPMSHSRAAVYGFYTLYQLTFGTLAMLNFTIAYPSLMAYRSIRSLATP